MRNFIPTEKGKPATIGTVSPSRFRNYRNIFIGYPSLSFHPASLASLQFLKISFPLLLHRLAISKLLVEGNQILSPSNPASIS
jgi:hypothetical protein